MKIIATIGPASSAPASVEALARAGATGFRLNGSHLEEEALLRYLGAVEAAGIPLSSVVLDLQGGKTRLESVLQPISFEAGEVLTLSGPSGTGLFRVDRQEWVDALAVGDLLAADDGRYRFRVEALTGAGVVLRALGKGELQSRKGWSVAGRLVQLPARLLERDRRIAHAALGLGVGSLAISFASSVDWLDEARKLAPNAEIVAKVEQPHAVDALPALHEAADALWFCRGDMGAEAGLVALPALQRKAMNQGIPMWIAGQVLHHMTAHPRPTRAEICHAGDLIHAGVVGFVLSDETAIGPYGPAAVEVLRQLSN